MKLPFTLQLGSLLFGLFTGYGVMVACSTAPDADCSCPDPLPVAVGEFDVQTVELQGEPPAELELLRPSTLRVQSNALTLFYDLGDETGSATFVR
jgi:hypothetical protein